MSARAGDVHVIEKHVRRIHLLIAACLGAIAVLLPDYFIDRSAANVEDDAMVSACKLPSRDGEMTVFIVENGKMKCWRWR